MTISKQTNYAYTVSYNVRILVYARRHEEVSLYSPKNLLGIRMVKGLSRLR